MPDNKYLETAFQIGSRLMRDALWSKDCCTWGGYVNSSNPEQVNYGTVEGDLYNGTSGISFFLAHLFEQTNDPLIKKTAIAGYQYAFKTAGRYNYNGRESLYAGLGGMAYSFWMGGMALKNDELLENSIAIIKDIISNNEYSLGNDVINGPPGFLPFLLGIKEKKNIPGLKEYIEKLINNIIFRAERSREGISWNTIENSTKNLTGYGHGAAGFALALTEAYNVFKIPEYKDLAIQACKYENYCFNETENNWPDYRVMSETNRKEKNSYMVAWCHGAPGIGASRARMFKILNEEFLIKDVHKAIKCTIDNDLHSINHFSPHYSLCHGLMGNTDLLNFISHIITDKQLSSYIINIADIGIERFSKYNIEFPSGINFNNYNPSLMLGESGIGHFYLRIFNNSIPSPLIILPENCTRN